MCGKMAKIYMQEKKLITPPAISTPTEDPLSVQWKNESKAEANGNSAAGVSMSFRNDRVVKLRLNILILSLQDKGMSMKKILKQNSCYIYNLCARTYTMAPYPPTTCQQV